MGYYEALEAAGATVHEFKGFGSYQGDWWAKVTYEGVTGWVHGSYGSCSGCDAFDHEFYWIDKKCEKHRYSGRKHPRCKACAAVKAEYEVKLVAFGRRYLDGIMTQEEAVKKASENLEWDLDAGEMVEYLKNH